MLFAEVRQKILDYSRENKFCRWIAKKLKIAHTTVSRVLKSGGTKNRRTRSNAGRPRKLNRADELKIKRVTMDRIQKNSLVNSRIIKNKLNLDVSLRTIQRKMKTMDFTYYKIERKIPSSKLTKNERIKFCKKMLTEDISTNFIIFSDEKKFSVDGPDNLCSYQKNDVATLNLPKRQGKGGSIIVLGCMVYPDKFYLTKTSSRMNSDEFIKLLETEIFPFLKNNIKASERGKYWWQQDNASVHTSRKTRDFLMSQPFKSLQWPARSPGLNIIVVLRIYGQNYNL